MKDRGFRVLVTGSRSWENVFAIENTLELIEGAVGGFTLVSGACPTGADRIAEEYCDRRGLPVERHPADWATHGRKAGFVRNAEMVATGANLCVAFIRNKSRGASMTADLAEKAGIPTIRVLDEDVPSDVGG